MRRYLVIDDNRAFAENLAEILRDNGDEVTVTTSGWEALALARQTRYDALLTDMRMPVMSGAQLVHEIRRVDPGLAAIAVTGYIGEGDLEDARRDGLLAVLPKPVPIPQLLSLLAVARRDGLVALVEDDVRLCENLAEALRDRGFTAVLARSIIEAERLAQSQPFAALVDLRLPGSPRGEVLLQLSERFRGMPLLVMTGFPDLLPGVKPHAIFQKPFDTARLLETLERLHPGARP